MINPRIQPDLIQQQYISVQCPAVIRERLQVIVQEETNLSWRSFIAGEMYEAVTRCLRCWIQSSATAGWKGTGSKLITRSD